MNCFSRSCPLLPRSCSSAFLVAALLLLLDFLIDIYMGIFFLKSKNILSRARLYTRSTRSTRSGSTRTMFSGFTIRSRTRSTPGAPHKKEVNLTEIDIFKDLIEWSKVHNFDGLIKYNQSINQKEEARALLNFRIQQQPDYFYILPESLQNKLGYTRRPCTDKKVLALAQRLGCREVYNV